MSSSGVATALNVLEALAFVVLIVHLRRSGLISSYRLFAAFLAFRLFRLAALPALLASRTLYAYAYFAAEAITFILATLVVLELYARVLQNHPGIARISRFALLAAVVVSSVVALISLQLDLVSTTPQTYLLDLFFVLSRVVMSSLMVFLVLITFFLYWFPVPISPNVANHCLLLAAYMGARTFVLLLRNYRGVQASPTLDLVTTILQLACLVGWIVLLRPSGEVVPRRRGRQLTFEEEKRLLGHLSVLNSTLSGSLKRSD